MARNLTERTELLLAPALKAALVRAADVAGVAPAAYIRLAIAEKIERDAAMPQRPTPQT